MEKRQELYRGKAKTVYATDDPQRLVMHYRDDVSAFDGAKLAKLDRKGETNNRINAFVMGKLADAGIRDAFRVAAERARVAGEGDEDDPGRVRRAQHLRGLDGQALRHRGRHAAAGADLRILPEERCAARSARQRRPHPRAGLGERRRDRADEGDDASRQRGAEAAVRECGHRPRRLQARVRPSAGRTGRDAACSATSSRPTAAGCGTATHRREDGQGPLPPRPRRASSRSIARSARRIGVPL